MNPDKRLLAWSAGRGVEAGEGRPCWTIPGSPEAPWAHAGQTGARFGPDVACQQGQQSECLPCSGKPQARCMPGTRLGPNWDRAGIGSGGGGIAAGMRREAGPRPCWQAGRSQHLRAGAVPARERGKGRAPSRASLPSPRSASCHGDYLCRR